MTKECFKCKRVLPLSQFYRHKMMADGHLNKCKDCAKSDVREHRRLNDSVRKYDRKRGSLPHRVQGRRDYAARYEQEHPIRIAAINAANNAVRDGKLKKEPCLFCGSEERVEKHHKDYSKPLDVIWLCVRCHRRLHANFPETVTDGDTV